MRQLLSPKRRRREGGEKEKAIEGSNYNAFFGINSANLMRSYYICVEKKW
jgi:hypothetical protein